MKESKFQKSVIDELKDRFPDCVVLKNDAGYKQGIPDLSIFWKDKWATLEVKESATASHRPNQDYYVNKMNEMAYSSFIFPENREEVMNELTEHFCTARLAES